MIRCDYCNTRIRARDGRIDIILPDDTLQLHSTHPDDCARQWYNAVKGVTGQRPPEPPPPAPAPTNIT